MGWSTDDIPDQTGRVAIVTGSNTGIGFETARALAAKGARVVLACRSRERGSEAVDRINGSQPAVSAEFAELDLSSLASVQSFAEAFTAENKQLDLLINNAGVMTPPESKTADGFELQIGVNLLGHFALTGRLFDALNSDSARIVTVSSLAHRRGAIDFDSFKGQKPYKAWREYQQSKLACLMFTLELQRRLSASGSNILSLAAHPGGTKTDLQRHHGLFNVLATFAMRPAQGALPTLYAATEPSAKGGEYLGPGGIYEMRGTPKPAKIAKQARDRRVGGRLWNVAEELTGVRFLDG